MGPSGRLPGEGEVVEAGDAEDRLVDSVAPEAAVAEDLLALHPGEGVLGAGSGPAVNGVLGFLLVREPAAAGFAVRDDRAGAGISAVSQERGAFDGPVGTGFAEGPAVVAFPGRGHPTATTRRVLASMITWWLVE